MANIKVKLAHLMCRVLGHPGSREYLCGISFSNGLGHTHKGKHARCGRCGEAIGKSPSNFQWLPK